MHNFSSIKTMNMNKDKTWTKWRRLLIYTDGFSTAKCYQLRIACCYENYLAYFLCGFLSRNEKFAEIRAGSLSRLPASPLDFPNAPYTDFQKDWFQTRRKFTYDCFFSSNMLHLCSNISECISTEPTNLSFPFTSKLNTFVRTYSIESVSYTHLTLPTKLEV